jgi:hypothetical protein
MLSGRNGQLISKMGYLYALACGLFHSLSLNAMMLSSYICSISLAIGATLAFPSVSSRQATPVAALKNGSYLGLHNSEYNQDFFLGLPYAQVRKLLMFTEY